MPQFQSAQLFLTSGSYYSSVLTPVHRVTNVTITPQISRSNVSVLGRGKPLEQRPIINYIPVDLSFDLVKSNINLEAILGLVNSSNVTTNLYDTKAASTTFATRDATLLIGATNASNWNGEMDLKSGVLTSYTLQGGVTDPVRCSIGMQFLDMTMVANNSGRTTPAISSEIVKPENVSLTGLQFSGLGLTGVNMQSFSFGLTLSRTSVMQLGQRFPVERPLIDANVTLQVQGFIEGVNNSMTGLGQYNCGYPIFGTVSLVLQPSCSTATATTITMKNPYLESQSFEAQVGGFTTVSLGFSMPLGPNPFDTGDGSVVTIT